MRTRWNKLQASSKEKAHSRAFARADDGTRTHDLLHGKRARAFPQTHLRARRRIPPRRSVGRVAAPWCPVELGYSPQSHHAYGSPTAIRTGCPAATRTANRHVDFTPVSGSRMTIEPSLVIRSTRYAPASLRCRHMIGQRRARDRLLCRRLRLRRHQCDSARGSVRVDARVLRSKFSSPVSLVTGLSWMSNRVFVAPSSRLRRGRISARPSTRLGRVASTCSPSCFSFRRVAIPRRQRSLGASLSWRDPETEGQPQLDEGLGNPHGVCPTVIRKATATRSRRAHPLVGRS